MFRSLLLPLALLVGCAGSASTTTPTSKVTPTSTGTDTVTHTSPGTITTDTTPTDTTPTGTPDCGPCPTGTSCGTANGIPVCRDDDTGIPRFEHVVVILMENTSLETLTKSTNTPYLAGLVSSWAYGTDYHGVEHPSLPNYVELVSGSVADNGPLDCDCDPAGGACNAITCNLLVSSCGCPQTGDHLGDQLDQAGLTWRAYGEDMGPACNLTDSGDYAVRHVPFLYFASLTGDTARCEDRVVDLSAFPGDLGGSPRTFSFIAPNLVHDMHDPFPASATNLKNGDDWLAAQVPALLSSSLINDRGLLVIVWDEDDLSGVLAPDDPIPLIVISPLAKQGGYASGVHADHDSLLATIEDGLGLGRLGNAISAAPLTDYFPAN